MHSYISFTNVSKKTADNYYAVDILLIYKLYMSLLIK